MKRIIILLAIMLLFAGCATTRHAIELTEISEKVTSSVVLIVMFDSYNNPVSQGTGFFVSEDGDVITNYHVIAGADTGFIKLYNEENYSIKSVIAEDTLKDLVRLSINIPQSKVVPLSLEFSYPEVGEKIVILGNPLGLERTLAVGYISAFQDFEGLGKLIQFDASISSGSSGSPLINMDGKVIGIVTSSFKEGENLNFAVPIEQILTLSPAKKEPIAEKKMKVKAEKWYTNFPEIYIPCLSLVDRDEYKNAIDCFEKIIYKNPNDGISYFWIGLCNDGLADSVNYLNIAKTKLENTIIENAEDTLSHYILALCYEVLSLHEEAIRTYKKLINIDPTFDEAYYNLGQLYLQLNQDINAIEYFEEAIRINPENVDALYSLGLIYKSLYKYKEACEYFIQVTKINNYHSDAYKNLGYIYKQIGLFEDAIQSYKKVIEIEPENLQTYFSIADIYKKEMKNKQKAFEYYVAILEYEPYNKDAIKDIVFIYQEFKMHKEAEELLKKLIKYNPDDWYSHQMLALHYSQWTYVYRDLDKEMREKRMYGRATLSEDAIELYEKSIFHYEQMIRISPNNSTAYYNIGQNYASIGRYNKAIYHFKKYMEIDPSYSSYDKLAYCYEELGKYKEAINNYKLAIKYETKDENLRKDWYYYNIGCIYLEMGDKKNAKKQYNVIKSMNSYWAKYLLEEINKN